MTTAMTAAPTGLRALAGRLRLDKYSALYLWAAFMVFFGLTKSETFLTTTTLKLVLTEKVLVAVLAIAFLVPLTTGTFDLSIGSMMAFYLALSTWLGTQDDMPGVIVMFAPLVACAIAGFVSGFIVVKLRVNSFIATLGMSQVLTASLLKISNNRQIIGAYSDVYRDIGRKQVLGLPLFFFYMVLLAIVVWYVLEYTPLGRYMFATGGNPEAARLAGVKTDRLQWGSLVASASIAGLAGMVFSWKVGNFSQSVGPGFLFPAVAAVFFGASQLRGRPNVWGTLIALFALSFGVKGLQLTFSTNTFWIEPLFEGLTLLIAVSLASRKGIIKVRRSKPQKDDTPKA
jgi:ribose transport system permease protein